MATALETQFHNAHNQVFPAIGAFPSAAFWDSPLPEGIPCLLYRKIRPLHGNVSRT